MTYPSSGKLSCAEMESSGVVSRSNSFAASDSIKTGVASTDVAKTIIRNPKMILGISYVIFYLRNENNNGA